MDISRIYLLFVLTAVIYLNEADRGRRRRESCGTGWKEMHRACYKFDKRKMSWEDAKRSCRSEGGDLTSISSVAEKKKVERELKKQIQKDDLLTWWIGLRFTPQTRKFIWEDGSTFNRRITNWGPGEPNSGRGRREEHCGEIKYDGFLNDQQCTELRPFICERHEITQRPIQTTVPTVTSTSTTIATTSATTANTTPATTTKTTPATTTKTTPATTTKTTSTTAATSTLKTTTTQKEAEDLPTINIPEITNNLDTSSTTTIITTMKKGTPPTTSTVESTETSTELPDTSSAFTSSVVTSSSPTVKTSTETTPKTLTTPKPSTTTKKIPSTRKTTTLPPDRSRGRTTTLSVLTSTTWEEKLSPFHGCFQLSESNVPLEGSGVVSAALTQQYKEGATTCPSAYASNMMWPDTPAGTFAEITCKSGHGKATWRCGSSPTCWRGEPNLAGCTSPKFQKILKKVLETSESPEEQTREGQAEVASALVEVTATDEVSVEDVMMTSKVIQSLATQITDTKPKDSKAVESIVKNVVKAGSNIVSENKSSTWDEMTPEDKVRSASNLLVAMETTTAAMAASIDRPTVFETKDENIDLELHVIDVNNIDVEDLVYDDDSSANTISISIDTLKRVSKGGLTKAVFMTHYKMAGLMEEKPTKTGETRKKPKIASSILSASLGTETIINLPEPITFTMKHIGAIPANAKAKCSFWDLRENDGYGHWSQDGCRVAETNKTYTTCKCDHLTNFAILMDVEGVQVELVHQKLLTFITIIGCIISIICLVACWITFTCFGSLQGERNSIHKNLVICLFVAEILFVFGIDKIGNELACRLIAGFLHYFFLCVFMWMFIEGIHMVVMLVQVFDAAKSRIPYYYMVGYGIPLIIVAVSAGFNYQGYGTDKFCWLTTENYFIWSFAGPVALILLVNAVILTYAMVMVCRHSEYVLNSKEKNQGSMRTWVQGALSMEVLLGLTWTIGYFFINMETIAMAYIFTILNSLQGLFIFSFHCLLNKKVLKEYKRVLHISKRRPGASTQSASLMRKQSQSYDKQNHEMSTKSSQDV